MKWSDLDGTERRYVVDLLIAAGILTWAVVQFVGPTLGLGAWLLFWPIAWILGRVLEP
jgi:hypothetical protein